MNGKGEANARSDKEIKNLFQDGGCPEEIKRLRCQKEIGNGSFRSLGSRQHHRPKGP